eukprot:scaffold11294_cov56-Cyclotella_meneghiniana.AAC.6
MKAQDLLRTKSNTDDDFHGFSRSLLGGIFTLSVAVVGSLCWWFLDEIGQELLMMLELECVIPRWLTNWTWVDIHRSSIL